MKTRIVPTLALLAAATLVQAGAQASTVLVTLPNSVSTFDDLPLASESYFAPGIDTTFTSGNATFAHNCNVFGGVCYWNGFTYSNTTDTTTAGYTNQYSAITGGGVNGSANYGVGNPGAGVSRVDFNASVIVNGAYFTNTTYAYLSMLNGDAFAKQFGPGDFFTLTVHGIGNGGNETGTVDVSLAQDTNLLDSWLWTDLSSLGAVRALEFSLSSSDVGPYGMNTPAYFAIDDLSVTAVPVPAAIWLFGSGLLVLTGLTARRK